VVVHCKKEPFDIYIGRPSVFGNPFEIGKDGSRNDVVEKHKVWLQTGENFGNRQATEELRNRVLKSLSVLKGKRLGCFC
jgi:hypothetical protein